MKTLPEVAGITLGTLIIVLALFWFGVPEPALSQMSTPPAATERVIEYTISMRDYRFHPNDLTAVVGYPVVLTLINPERITPHNFTLETGAAEPVIVDIGAGETKTVRFTPNAPGTYTFYCKSKLLWFKSHRDHGMEGTLRVLAKPGKPGG